MWFKDSELNQNLKIQISELNRSIFPENLINDEYIFDQKKTNPQRLIVQIENEVVAHLLTVRRNIQVGTLGLDIIYVGELMVKESFRGKGLGRELITKLKENNFKADVIILLADKGTEGFYIKNGFEELSNLKILIGDSQVNSKFAASKAMVILLTQRYIVLRNKNASTFLGDPV